MMQAIQRFIRWLGPPRAYTLFGVTAATGLISLMMQAVLVETGAEWAIPVQNAMVILWLVSTAVIIGGRMEPENRRILLWTVGPLLVSIAIGIIFSRLFLWFLGAGVGWLILANVLIRRNVRREYQQAIRHMRRAEFDEAIGVMNDLIKAERTVGNHYRFRAELHRLNGKPHRAIKDYEKLAELEPGSGVGYNGLAEVYLQLEQFEEALNYAQMAYEREPDEWVTPYNLGMIEDRMGHAAGAIAHLGTALKIPGMNSRHKLLSYLWIARAHARLGQDQEASNALDKLRREQPGLREWQTIFANEEADVLRAVLGEDIELAGRIVDGAGVEALARPEANV